MFDGTVKGLVKDVLEGQNSLVFTYGVTNAGKTFTFLGLYILCYCIDRLNYFLKRGKSYYILIKDYKDFIFIEAV